MTEVLEAEEESNVVGDAHCDVIDRLRSMEVERCRIAFEQYRLAVELLRRRVMERVAAGQPQARWQLGVAAEIGLALRMSPNRAAALLSRARELEQNMPCALERLRSGELSPEAVPLIVCGLSHLEPALRTAADEKLCADAATLAGFGPQKIKDAVQKVAYALDKQATVDRIANAEKDRTVTIRPLPDAMARVSLLLPVAQAVGVFATLKKQADAVVGVGAELRNRGQIMADSAFALLTGREAAAGQPVAVNLTMPAAVLLGGEPGVAHLRGGGAIPAEIARKLVGKATAAGTAWVKRLFVVQESGAVVAMDSRARFFPDALAEVIAARDQYCRTPYCDAPIAHIDHVLPHAAGGATGLGNGQGLCAACNYAKEAHGWRSAVVDDPTGRHTVETRTPSGHRYRSTAPDQAA
ncbi:HNH endonuclease signature motif containing protein [Tsukamurella sp. 1534]|uniref:HNH endonuclease n=1 Tax=Tsukamurella sp. 1534 TaxID=1151061 RepID=UPI0002F534E2|nr:HNH endonuclease signature motif containing protein [Tsukamurella sp. 1534]